MAESTAVIWRYTNENKWSLYNNTQYQLPVVKEEPSKASKDGANKASILKKEKNTPFYFAKIKSETKGSVVYTPKGYGIIQGIKLDSGLISVKVNNEVSDYSKNDVINEIPIDLTFISNSGKREDKTLLSMHSTAKDVIEKIESEHEGDTTVAMRIFFKGKELSKSNETLEKMGITPFSKFLIISTMGKPLIVTRFGTIYQGWGYSASSVDGVSFSVSKDIRVIGFGIYTPEVDTPVTGTARFVSGNDAKGAVLFQREVSVVRNLDNPENKVWRCMFDRPIKVKAGDVHCCVVELKNGNTHYGSGGNNTSTGEGDVVFNFLECVGSFNGTGPSSGQVPEIYYFA
jgi:hypothetical protein